MEEHWQSLIKRVVSGSSVVALCTPPGFFKSRLAMEAGQRISDQTGSPLSHFGLLEHSKNRTAATDRLLSCVPQVMIIEDATKCDGPLLVQALERINVAGGRQKVILVLSEMRDLPLARMFVRNPPNILDANSLRLTPEEIGAVLKRQLRPKIRARIRELAGDWPIALELLVRWASSKTSASEKGSDLDILRESGLADFIAQEIMPLFSADELLALFHASILQAPDLDTLASVADERSNDRILADLAYRMKGLVDRDGDRICIQYAFRVYLREIFELPDRTDRRQLLLGLADRCAAKGRLGDAAAIARMAGNSDRIQDYANANGALRIWIIHGFSILKDFVENASPEDLANSAVLRMMECIVHLKSGRIRVAQQLIEGLAAEIGPDDPLARDLEIVRVTLLVYGCSIERAGDLNLLRQVIAEQADDPAMGTFVATLSCIINTQRARFDAARANLIEARAQAKKVGSRYNLMFLFMHEAAICLAQGKLKQMRTCVSEARRLWQREFAHDVGAETAIAALSASVEFEAGQLTSARNSVRRSAHRLPDDEAWFDIYFAAYEAMVRLNIADHGLGATLEVIEIEARKLTVQGLPRVADLIVAMGFCVVGEARIRGEAVAVPEGWILPIISGTASWQEHELFTLAQAYQLQQEGRSADAEALLDRAISEAAANCLERSGLRYRLAAFACSASRNGSEVGPCYLMEAVAIGARTGMRQIFREFRHGALNRRLECIASDPTLDEIEKGFVTTLINRLNDRAGKISGKLSERERDVLRLLTSGGSDKQLARQLDISEHGVRYHLKSIFKKLGVHDRLSAIAAARKQGLIKEDY